ncbi:MAG: FHA domain-containing protein [Flavobacteriales bacterium]
MQGFQKCNNGHFFKEGMAKCPYCPTGDAGSSAPVDLNKTQITSNFDEPEASFDGGDKTEVVSPNGPSHAAAAPTDRTERMTPPSPSQAKKNQNLDRTFIQGVEEVVSVGEDGPEVNHRPVGSPRASRRMVGWLVSYSLDPMGLDYRIYEGNNTVGRENSNSIIIKQDTVISSKHINILYRKERYWIRDEMSANGTLLNGEDLDLDKVYELHDGDLIKIGNTTFKFKSSL